MTPRERAISLLARREHSERELRRKLVASGIKAETAAAVVDDLVAAALVDNRRFAAFLVRRRSEAGYGPGYILAELSRHGISAAEAGAALTEVDFEAIARRVLAKRLGPGKPGATMRARAAQLLLRRGFPTDLIARLTRVAEADLDGVGD